MRVKELKKKSNTRFDTGYIQTLGIQSYGQDNLYPQVLRNIIAASSTGSECVERFANFIEGNGFRAELFSEYVVNRRGDTADDIHALVCKDVADFDGMALHVNYNVLGDIVELHHIPFENCRLMEEDANGYMAKIAIHPDWTGKKTRKGKAIQVKKDNIDYIDVFNPRKEVVLAQIEGSQQLFNIVFFITLLSLVIQGMTITKAAAIRSLCFAPRKSPRFISMAIPISGLPISIGLFPSSV